MSLCKAASVLMLEIKQSPLIFVFVFKKETNIIFSVLSQLFTSEVKTMTSSHLHTAVWASGSGFRHLGRVVVFVSSLSHWFQESFREQQD